LVDHNGENLTEPKGFDLNVDRFIEFLDTGLKEFKERNK
jgi:thiol:disulfide interchange protein DsbD